MARASFRRHAAASSEEGRFLASRIQDARRKGYSNRVIADSFGINERTVRKIVSGETSGKRLYRQHVAPSRGEIPAGASRSIVRLDLVIGKDAAGRDVIRTVNAKTPLVRGRTPTPFDVLRIPDLVNVANMEAERLRRQYAGLAVIRPDDEECQRSYCGHAPDEHIGSDDPDDATYPCTLCECPDFLAAPVRINSIRPIVRRKAKYLATIIGATS